MAVVIAAFVASRFIGLEAAAIDTAGAAVLKPLDNVGKVAEQQTENVTKSGGSSLAPRSPSTGYH